jgi:hypothetical protein
MDPMNQSQQVDTRSRGKVALEALQARLDKIVTSSRRFTGAVLGGVMLWWVILFICTRDVAKANYLFTNSFQFLAVAWCCWFMYPYFLRVEAKQDVSLAMGHDSVDVLDRLNRTIDERIQRVDLILGRLDSMTAEAERAGAVKKALEAIDQIKADMAGIRAKIDRDTAPLKVHRRPIGEEVPASEGDGRGRQS